MLQALALEKLGDTAAALVALQEAVAMAAPGGWIRPFIEAPIEKLLMGLAESTDHGEFVQRALAGRESAGSLPRAAARATPMPMTERRGPRRGPDQSRARYSRPRRAAAPEQGNRSPAAHFRSHRQRSPEAHLSKARREQAQRGRGRGDRSGHHRVVAHRARRWRPGFAGHPPRNPSLFPPKWGTPARGRRTSIPPDGRHNAAPREIAGGDDCADTDLERFALRQRAAGARACEWIMSCGADPCRPCSRRSPTGSYRRCRSSTACMPSPSKPASGISATRRFVAGA